MKAVSKMVEREQNPSDLPYFNMGLAKNFSIRKMLDKDAELAAYGYSNMRVSLLQLVETEIYAYLDGEDQKRCKELRDSLISAYGKANIKRASKDHTQTYISLIYAYRQMLLTLLKKYGFEQPNRDDPSFALGRGGI